VTDPAFDAGTLVASPMAKMLGLANDCRVSLLVGTKFKSSPRPSLRPT
jgi:hypothetical protein